MKDYHTRHQVLFEVWEEFPAHSYTSLPVLPFLIGRKWGPVALAYVGALNPRAIRVTTGEVTLDGTTDRVTVWVDDLDVIQWVEMGVRIGIPEGYEDGTSFHWEPKMPHYWDNPAAEIPDTDPEDSR